MAALTFPTPTQLKNIGDPTANSDAATKSYVDSQIGSGSSNYANYAGSAFTVSGSNVSGQVGNALIAGTVYTNAQPNITSVGTLTSLDVTGNTSFSGANVSLGAIGNLHITGGTANYIISTDGSGNLSWVAPPTVSTITVDSFTGNGVQTIFTLSTTPTNINQTTINYNGATVLRADYSVSGANVTFSSAPSDGSLIEITTVNLTSSGDSGSSYIEVTSNITASVNKTYIVNTDTANLTITLPSNPTLGQEVGIIDGTGNASVHAITVARNGSKIQGSATNMTVTTNRSAFTLVYYNTNQGWILTKV